MPSTQGSPVQVKPAAATAETLLLATQDVLISTIPVANVGGSSDTYRIWVRLNGEMSVSDKNYIAFDIPLPTGVAVGFTLGMLIGAGDRIEVQSLNGSLAFNAFFMKVTL